MTKKKKQKKHPLLHQIIPKLLMLSFIIVAAVQTVSAVYLSQTPEYVNAADNLKLNIPIGNYGAGEGIIFNNTTKPIAQYVQVIYKYATGVVGIVAAVILMWGGVVWLTAGGSAERVGDAKKWIGASLSGMVLVLGAYMILYQVNPELVSFQPMSIPTITKIASSKLFCKWTDVPIVLETGSPCPKGYYQNSAECKNDKPQSKGNDRVWQCCCSEKPSECLDEAPYPDYCQNCVKCSLITIETKHGNQANSNMVLKLSSAQKDIIDLNKSTGEKTIDDIVVTEAWPPTEKHSRPCHYNGACVDVNLKSKSTDPKQVAKVYKIMTNVGLSPVYECNKTNCCKDYKDVIVKINTTNFTVDVNCLEIAAITAPHFSVY